jgi:hypothetical protein
MLGRVIYQSAITGNETVIALQVANGIYNVRLISQENKMSTTKVFINR